MSAAEPRTGGPVATAAALVIGNELLTGKIKDANLSVLATVLRRIGVRLVRANTIRDEMDTIVDEVRALSAAHTWVFTSGGVGPTHDDLTIDAIGRAFDAPVSVAPELRALLERHYGDALTESHVRMARVPEGARLVSNARVPWPIVQIANVWVLPGVPEIFALKMQVVEEDLRARGGGTPLVSISVTLQRDEGYLKPSLDAVVEAFPAVEIGSYPRFSDPTWRTKITFDGTDRLALADARAALIARLPDGEPTRLEGDPAEEPV